MLKHILYAPAHGYDNIKEAKSRETELEISHTQKKLLIGAEKMKVPLSLNEYQLLSKLIIYCFVVLIKNSHDHWLIRASLILQICIQHQLFARYSSEHTRYINE